MMTENWIKVIYDSIKEIGISFSEEEQKEYNNFWEVCKTDYSKHLFFDNNQLIKCECLSIDEMRDKAKSGVYQVQMTDLNLKKFNIDHFCIYCEIRTLKFLEKPFEEIRDYILKKYQYVSG